MNSSTVSAPPGRAEVGTAYEPTTPLRVRLSFDMKGRPHMFEMQWHPQVTLQAGLTAFFLSKLGVPMLPRGLAVETEGRRFPMDTRITDVSSELFFPSAISLALVREDSPPVTGPNSVVPPVVPQVTETVPGVIMAGLAGSPSPAAPPATAAAPTTAPAAGAPAMPPAPAADPPQPAPARPADPPPASPSPVSSLGASAIFNPIRPAVDPSALVPPAPTPSAGSPPTADTRTFTELRPMDGPPAGAVPPRPADPPAPAPPAPVPPAPVQVPAAAPVPASVPAAAPVPASVPAAAPPAPPAPFSSLLSSLLPTPPAEKPAAPAPTGTGSLSSVMATLPMMPKGQDRVAAPPRAPVLPEGVQMSGVMDALPGRSSGKWPTQPPAPAAPLKPTVPAAPSPAVAKSAESVIGPAAAPAPPPVKMVRRRAGVRWARRMVRGRTHPLTVVLTAGRPGEIRIEGAPTARMVVLSAESVPMVTVRPVVPGCLCWPAEQTIDVSSDPLLARFTLVPVVGGGLADARVELHGQGRLLGRVLLTGGEVVESGTAVWLAAASLLWPVAAALLPAAEVTSRAAGHPLMAALGRLLELPFAGEVGMLVTLAAAGVMWLTSRPEGAVIESDPMDLPASR